MRSFMTLERRHPAAVRGFAAGVLLKRRKMRAGCARTATGCRRSSIGVFALSTSTLVTVALIPFAQSPRFQEFNLRPDLAAVRRRLSGIKECCPRGTAAAPGRVTPAVHAPYFSDPGQQTPGVSNRAEEQHANFVAAGFMDYCFPRHVRFLHPRDSVLPSNTTRSRLLLHRRASESNNWYERFPVVPTINARLEFLLRSPVKMPTLSAPNFLR